MLKYLTASFMSLLKVFIWYWHFKWHHYSCSRLFYNLCWPLCLMFRGYWYETFFCWSKFTSETNVKASLTACWLFPRSWLFAINIGMLAFYQESWLYQESCFFYQECWLLIEIAKAIFSYIFGAYSLFSHMQICFWKLLTYRSNEILFFSSQWFKNAVARVFNFCQWHTQPQIVEDLNFKLNVIYTESVPDCMLFVLGSCSIAIEWLNLN